MKKRRWVRLTALCLCLLLTGCGRYADRVRPAAAPAAVSAATGVHKNAKAREEMTRVSRAEMTVLYFDEESRSIAVYDANAGKLWRALPEKTDAGAAMLTLQILADGQLLTLNTQDDCDPAHTEVTTNDDGVLLRYRFQKPLESGETLTFTLPLEVTVTDGCMRVRVDCASLAEEKLPRGVKLLSLSVLPFFGAQTQAGDDDFLLLPDGCGSVIYTKGTPETFDPVAIPAYAPDENGACARVAAFGQRVENGGFVALAEEGDALLTVHAEKRTKAGGVDRVYPAFTLTETKEDARGTLYCARQTTDAVLTLSYRFLAGETATPMGMAAACRELLLRGGTLDLLTPMRNDQTMPFHLSLIGAATVQTAGKTTRTLQTLTDFSAAQELLEYLRSKGIGNIRLRYRGLLLGALAQRSFRLSSTVSGVASLQSFTSAVQPLGVTVYPEARLLTGADGTLPKTARDRFGKKQTAAETILQTPALSSAAMLSRCAADRLDGRTHDLLVALRRLGADRVCIPDAATVLSVDCASKQAPDAQKTRDLVASQLSSLAAERPLMLDGANLYALKYAESVLNVPMAATYTNALTTSVPFLQAILHGYTFYSGEAMNLADDPQEALLLAAQCGAAPYYEWYAADYGTPEQPDALSYIQSIAQAQQSWQTLQTLFDGLCDKPITAFETIRDGVTCTTFGAEHVYVNFTDAPVTADGVTVPARGVLRVAA